jgi:hypothetical protein
LAELAACSGTLAGQKVKNLALSEINGSIPALALFFFGKTCFRRCGKIWSTRADDNNATKLWH